MKLKPIILLAAAALLPSCGATVGISYDGFRLDVNLPAKKPKPEPPLPVDDGTGKTPVLVEPDAT